MMRQVILRGTGPCTEMDSGALEMPMQLLGNGRKGLYNRVTLPAPWVISNEPCWVCKGGRLLSMKSVPVVSCDRLQFNRK